MASDGDVGRQQLAATTLAATTLATTLVRGARRGLRRARGTARLGLAALIVGTAVASAQEPVFNTTVARTPEVEAIDATGAVPPDAPAPETEAQPEPAAQSEPAAATVAAISLSGDARRTELRIGLSHGVRAEIFTLADPYRVVIDLPAVDFDLAEGVGRTGRGLVKAFRYGLFSERKGRIVLDASGPLRIESARLEPARGNKSAGKPDGMDLLLIMAPVSAAEFGATPGVRLPDRSPPRPSIHEDEAPAKPATSRPVVLIDPGHGGIDPGAMGSSLMEKQVALAVAQKVRRRLEASGRYDVKMTRTTDVFVSLEQRVQLSRKVGADLFISLHADSIASRTYAPVVRGATVYTLSEQASDEQARLMAEKENAADLLAGLDTAGEAEDDAVRGILIDLLKRETANFSADFSHMLVSSLGKSVSMAREPRRSAAFKVLKQTHAPSVLVELGFMSNAADEKLMRQATWQAKVAASIVAAVDAFFDKRLARGP